MKYYSTLIGAAILSLSACSQEPGQTPPASQSAASPAASAATPAATASAPAASPPSAASNAAAGSCSLTVEANDTMKYNTGEIAVSKTCKSFDITLKNTGTLPKTAMGHDLVIAKAADTDAIVSDGASAGADNNFLKAGDSRVIAHTPLIGPGEEAVVRIDPAELSAGDYEFFCSFPGHLANMRGKIKLVD